MRPAFALLLLCGVMAPAADREFEAVVRHFESAYGQKKMHIPLLGAVKFFSNVARPMGGSGLQLAIWGDVDNGDLDGLPPVQAPWRPWVVTRSHNESTYIYVNPSKGNWKMLIISLEPNQTNVVQVKLNGSALRRWLRDPVHQNRHRRNQDDE